MKALITGGAGFIGSHLADRLASDTKNTVVVLDDYSSGKPANLDKFLIQAGTDAITGSVTDPEFVDALVAKTDVVYHLAAQIDVRKSVADPVFDAQVNIMGTLNVLTSAHRHGVKVVFVSTGGAMYDEHDPVPWNEGAAKEPMSAYGVSKRAAEKYIEYWNRLHGTDHAIVRLANVYGPRQDPHGEAGVVAIFCGAFIDGKESIIFGDGNQARDFVYVDDVVDGILKATDFPGVYNLGTGQLTTVNQLYRAVARSFGSTRDPLYRPERKGEMKLSALDSNEARMKMGWIPTVALSEGIQRTADWFRIRSESDAFKKEEAWG